MQFKFAPQPLNLQPEVHHFRLVHPPTRCFPSPTATFASKLWLQLYSKQIYISMVLEKFSCRLARRPYRIQSNAREWCAREKDGKARPAMPWDILGLSLAAKNDIQQLFRRGAAWIKTAKSKTVALGKKLEELESSSGGVACKLQLCVELLTSCIPKNHPAAVSKQRLR